MAGNEQVESFLLSTIFVSADSFVAVNPPLTASCGTLAVMFNDSKSATVCKVIEGLSFSPISTIFSSRQLFL